MERRITRHATRLSAAHEAALDPQFAVGQRVRTLDGFTGRVLFIEQSFSPGADTYEVELDGGTGRGSYLASQLRPVPEAFGGGHQAPAYLPAGVTAALEAEADLDPHTADLDYPEMGTILHERPDPGRQITMIGSRHTAAPFPYAQQKLFHMQPDPRLHGEESGRHNPEDPYGYVHWRSEHDEDYEPDECEHCGADKRDPESHAEAHENWLNDQEWHTDWDAEGPGDTLHRGIAERLPHDLHAHIHDESVPVAERAQALVHHVIRGQAEGSPHAGLGNFWSDEPDVSKSYAETTHHSGYSPGYKRDQLSGYQTPVMLHVRTPGREHFETDPDTLREWGVHSFHKADNREVPLQHQTPLRIKGISWARPDHGFGAAYGGSVPEHLHEDPAWTHHEFGGEGIHALASIYADGYDERDEDYNGEPPVGGIYWQAPAQQAFVHDEGLDQPEEPMAPAPMQPVATTINNQKIDDHGDAPDHGSRPRAQDPDAYDGESTEGQGDPKWDDAMAYGGMSAEEVKKRQNGAAIGMYPEGVSAGGGPGISVGPFVASTREEKGDRWHEYRNRYLGGTLHRGIHVRLPGDLHDYVHDESQPREERARALAEHFSRSGLGMHWTPHLDIAHRAIGNAADREYPPWFENEEDRNRYWDSHNDPATDVMLHATTGQRNRLRNPEELERHQIGRAYSEDEDEFPVKPGSPMRLEGISWRQHDPQFPAAAYEHVDFPKPMRHEARVPWTPHERTQLHNWQSGEGAAEGDFVPSYEFTNKYPEYVPEPDPSALTVEAVGERYEPYQHLPPDFWQREHVPGTDIEELGPYDTENAEEDVASPGQHAGYERRYRTMHTLSGRHSFPEDTPEGQHLMHGHGWGAGHVRRALERGNRLSDIHDAVHETGMSNHEHTGDPRHEEELRERFGPEMGPVDRRRVDPRRGGTPAADPLRAVTEAHPQDWAGLHERMPLHKLNAATPEVIGPRAFAEHVAAQGAAEAVYRQLSDDYPPDAIAWVREASWSGPVWVPFDQVDWDARKTWSAYHQPDRVRGFARKGLKKEASGEHLNPSVAIRVPGSRRMRLGDGHHRGLSYVLRAAEGGHDAPEGVLCWIGTVAGRTGPWDEMHAKQLREASAYPGSKGTGSVPGAEGTPQERREFQEAIERGLAETGAVNETSDVSASSLNAGKAGDQPGNKRKNPPKSPQDRSQGVPRAGMPSVPDRSFSPPMSEGGTPSKKKQVKSALRAMEHAAGDAAFRFEFTSSWHDVQAKARRMRREGKVRIVMARHSLVIGEVDGDHATYEAGIQTHPGRPGSVMAYICGCPWATFHQNEPRGISRFAGRMCSHALAVRYEANSRGMFGRAVTEDERRPGWEPHDVVVRSAPPYEGDPHKGRWREQWLAPAAAKTAAADSPWMRPPWSEEELGDHLYHQHGWSQDKVQALKPKERWRQHVQEHNWGVVDNAARNWQERTVAHQHETPRGTEGEEHWPDVFRPVDETDFTGGTRGGPHRHLPDILADPERHAPFGPLPPHMSRFMTVDEARERCRQDPVYQAARILLGHGEDTRQIAALMALAGADPDALIRRHMDIAHTEGLGARQYPGGLGAHEYHQLLHDKGAAAIVPHRHEVRQPAAQQDPQLRAVEAVLLMTADQANAPWGAGSEHVDSPAKPYGATSPPEKDRDPGSYGPLAGPDPDNWGEIQDGSFVQMPLSNTAAAGTMTRVIQEPRLSHGGPDEPPPGGGGGGDDNPKNHFLITRHKQKGYGTKYSVINELDYEHPQRYTGYEHSFEDAVHHLAHLQAEGHYSPVSVRYATKLDAKRTTDITPEFHNHYARWFEPGSPGYRPHSDAVSSARDMNDEDLAEHARIWHSSIEPGSKAPLRKAHQAEHLQNQGASLARGSRADACPSAWSGWTRKTAQDCGYRGPSGHEHAPSMKDLFGGHDPSSLYDEPSAGPGKLSALVNKQVDGPDMLDWIPEHQDSFPYSDQANTSGPSTSISPGDPDGIRMEESLGEPEQPGGALAELKDEPDAALDPEGLTGASDGTIGGGDTGAGGPDDWGAASSALLSAWGSRDKAATDLAWAQHVARTYQAASAGIYNQARDPGVMSSFQQAGAQQPDEDVTQNPGMGSWDEPSVPDDQSIQTVGQQQWSGGGSDSDETAVEPGQPQGDSIDAIVASFQRSAAGGQYAGSGGNSRGPGMGDGDIAAAARAFLKTADVLPPEEADELIREGRGTRARNLDLLRLEGTHYADDPRLDEHEDDAVLI